ncbi:MAG: glycosyltransferase family 39 protein [Vicinamibacterales bacterium]
MSAKSWPVALTVLSLAVFSIGLAWGLPTATRQGRDISWAPDDLAPLQPLTEIHHILAGSPDELQDRWLAYPLFHHFVLGAVYAPYLGVEWLTGGFAHPTAAFPYGFSEPERAFRALTILARLVSVGFSAGLVMLAFHIGRVLWDAMTGVVAGAIVLVQYPFHYYSKTATLDVPYLFWSAIGMLYFAKLLVGEPTGRRFAVLGAAAGLAAATKDQAAMLFLPVALLPILLRRLDGRWPAARQMGLLVACGLATYAFGSGLVVDHERYVAHIGWLVDGTAQKLVGYRGWYPWTLEGQLEHTEAMGQGLVRFMGPVLVAAAVLGVAHLAATDRRRLLFGLPVLSYIAAFLIPVHLLMLRFLLPVSFALAVFAAYGLVTARRRWVRGPILGGVLLAVALLPPAVTSAGVLRELLNDTRTDAEDWLATHASSGVLAYCGDAKQLPRLLPSLDEILLPPDLEIWVAPGARPEWIVTIPDWTSARDEGRSQACPAWLSRELEESRGTYRVAAEFDHGFRRDLLDYPSLSPPIVLYRRVD